MKGTSSDFCTPAIIPPFLGRHMALHAGSNRADAYVSSEKAQV